MPASAAALRAAIHGALKNDGPLAAMLGGGKIYDEPPSEAALPVARGVDLIGRSFRYRVGPVTQDVGSPQMTEFETAVGATALLPWSPVHLAAARNEAGIVLTWTRRTRSGGDGWDTLEVPLGEEREAYRVEILDGESIVRTLETEAPQALYANADEAVDFGGALSSIAFRVSQLSAVAGAGRARNALIPL